MWEIKRKHKKKSQIVKRKCCKLNSFSYRRRKETKKKRMNWIKDFHSSRNLFNNQWEWPTLLGLVYLQTDEQFHAILSPIYALISCNSASFFLYVTEEIQRKIHSYLVVQMLETQWTFETLNPQWNSLKAIQNIHQYFVIQFESYKSNCLRIMARANQPVAIKTKAFGWKRRGEKRLFGYLHLPKISTKPIIKKKYKEHFA